MLVTKYFITILQELILFSTITFYLDTLKNACITLCCNVSSSVIKLFTVSTPAMVYWHFTNIVFLNIHVANYLINALVAEPRVGGCQPTFWS